MGVLPADQIDAGLPKGWSREGDAIQKRFEFETFPSGIAFVNLLADAAEDANHHPDLDIRYNKVLVTLSTHSEGGVTEKDLDLAGKAEQLAQAAGEGGA